VAVNRGFATIHDRALKTICASSCWECAKGPTAICLVEKTDLVLLHGGRRGRLRSQHDDAHYFHGFQIALLLLCSLFQLCVRSFVVRFESRSVCVAVLLTKHFCFFIKRLGQVDSTTTLVRLGETVVNVR